MIIQLKASKCERVDKIMCKILRELKGKKASELLELYDVSTNPPIDIIQLLNKIGISAIPTDFSEIESEVGLQPGDILGATVAKDENLSIFYKENVSVNRKRFTIAHELAHCCIHSDNLIDHHIELRSQEISNSGKEFDANVFAGELLIPKESIIKICEQIIQPNLSVLANIFKVSPAVMLARLEYLRLPYYRDTYIKDI